MDCMKILIDWVTTNKWFSIFYQFHHNSFFSQCARSNLLPIDFWLSKRPTNLVWRQEPRMMHCTIEPPANWGQRWSRSSSNSQTSRMHFVIIRISPGWTWDDISRPDSWKINPLAFLHCLWASCFHRIWCHATGSTIVLSLNFVCEIGTGMAQIFGFAYSRVRELSGRPELSRTIIPQPRSGFVIILVERSHFTKVRSQHNSMW
jgi:hypothetical protein